ncbi:MAG: AMP-binding protein [Treponema sp.]|nr:AMP-binding protein [Treponema sp.]
MTTDEPFRKYTDEKTFSRIVNYETVTRMWKNCLEQYGDMNAVCYDGRHYTFRELEEDAADFRGALNDNGVQKGDRLGLLCSNSYDFVKALIAILTNGNSAVILPAHIDGTTVFGCSIKLEMKTIVVQDELEEKTDLATSKGVEIIRTSAKSNRPSDMCETRPDDECLLMFTGGTTGKSKASVLSNEAVMQGTTNGCYCIRNVFNQKYMLVIPLSHVFGLIRNLMTSLYTGSELFICRNNKDMFRDMASFRPTILVAVPALVELGLKLSKQLKKNMFGPDLKCIISGAATVSPYLISECSKIGISLYPGYGLTESANLVSGNPENITHPESVGYLFPNQEYRIVEGELWLKGKNMLTEYAGEPEENRLSFEDGWFKTGDLAHIDENGFLYITGRLKETIRLPTGESISPSELESKFNELSFIQDSQVFEDVDESSNHFLALEVYPRQNELEKISSEDKNAYLMEELEKINSSLPSFQRVSKITIRTTDFERSPSMKMKRYDR